MREFDTDGDLRAVRFQGTIWDTDTRGLRVTIGVHRVTWTYFKERQFRGTRSAYYERLGFWPQMNVAQARAEALQHAARAVVGPPRPGRKEAKTLDAALAEYVAHLRAQAKKRHKPATWAALVESLTRIHLLPTFGQWTLIELSKSPAAVKAWHAAIDSKVSGNRCASVLSATYRYAKKLDRSLPPENPCSAVAYNDEEAAQTAIPFDQFPAWAEAVAKLPPLRAAFYRFCLLTGARSGEVGRLQWSDVNCQTRTITFRHSKSGKDIVAPLSAAIARELKRARDVKHDGPLIFPGAKKWEDALPAKGHALRHSFATVCADLGINQVHSRMLMGHSLSGVHASYITAHILTGGPGLRAAQATISRRIVTLLGPA